MKYFLTFYFFLAFFPGISARATSVSSRVQLGNTGYDTSLVGSGDLIEGSTSKQTPDLFWSLETDYSQTSSSDSSGNSIIDHSYNVQPGVGYQAGNGFGVESYYSYSMTPEESLRNSGGELDLSYSFNLVRSPSDVSDEKQENAEKGSDSDDRPFVPTMKVKFGGRYQQYVQTFSDNVKSQKTGVVRPTTGFNHLRQVAALADISISPWEPVFFDLTLTYYFYDLSVPNFLAFIDSPSAARFGVGGFSSTITSFSQSTLNLAASIYPMDKWSVDLSVINSVSILDLSLGWSYKGMLKRELGDWKLGVGYEHDNSSLSGTSAYWLISLAYYL